MTIIYLKEYGDIKGIYSGDLQHIDTLFGDRAELYKKIYDEIVLPDDPNVINNYRLFKVNSETKEIELLLNAKYQKNI